MIKSIIGKVVTYGIVFLFLFTSFFSVNESLALMNSNSMTSPSFSSTDQRQINIEKGGAFPYSIAPSNTKSHDSIPLEKPHNDHNILESDKGLLERDHIAYAYNGYDPSGQHPMGWVIFNLDDPGSIDLLGPGFASPSGADFLNDVIMYFVSFEGGLYRWDVPNGQITYIGPTIPLLGLTFDSFTGIWYASDADNLYSIDINTAATTFIGPFNTINTLIDIACDTTGNLYAYDVLWTGESTLYSVNTSTGAATAIGLMGYGCVYAQGMAYDRDNAVLYIAGYFNNGMPSALLTCDVTTGLCTIVGYFECGMELCGFAIPWSPIQFNHDISIYSIVRPDSGSASPITPIVNVINIGTNTETNIPVNLRIGKELLTGSIEDFEENNGSYIHSAYLTDSWQWGTPTSGPGTAYSGSNLWATVLNGNYPNSMWSGLRTQPFIVPAGANFKFWNWYDFEFGWDGGNVKISTDGGTTFTIITPIGGYPGTLSNNPYMTGQPGYTGQGGASWNQAEFDLGAYEGMTVIILWEAASDSSVTYAGWYIDDVGFSITSWINEYNQTVTIPLIESKETLNIPFPVWTPADLGMIENFDINYLAEATNLFMDNNTNNDYKEKPFTLHYGLFNDISITQIITPASGHAIPQTPEVVIENHGQFPEIIDVNMSIGKALYTTLLEENFADGVPPAGWGTNYPENWFSSSTSYAGGEAPEAEFSWTPSSVGEHYLWTNAINTTGYTLLSLKYKEYVNDYNSEYTLKVVTSTDGGITWQEAYTRAGGPYGPTTTEIILTTVHGIGSANLQIAWDFSGDSFNINYWYIDDVWLGIMDMAEEYNEQVQNVFINSGETLNVVFPEWTPTDIPFASTIDYLVDTSVSMDVSDENPSDNELAKMITLSYEHDAGVVAITQYPGSAANGREIIWDNYDDDGTGTGLSSQLDLFYPFNSQCADDFQFNQAMEVNQVHWWGAFWNGVIYPNPTEFNIIFYADEGGMPTGAGMDDPTSTALAVYNFPAVTGVLYGTNKYEYDVTLDPVFVAEAATHYWIAIQEVASYADCGQWGWSTNGANPEQLSGPVQGFPLLGTAYWTATAYGDHAFQLGGQTHQGSGGNPPPGTYPIAGIIQNLGFTYSEVNIPVNAIIINDTNTIVYDETVIIPGPLIPGEIVTITFPDIIIPWDPAAEHDYKITMKTMLPDDDHPENDSKIQTWIIQIPDTTPPTTTATVSGTMGNNGWYIGPVQIILTATDGKWPLGVNHTYIKIDSGDWMIYTVPYVFDTGFEGQHTILFYSDDKAIPPNVEEIQQVTIKIDMSSPQFTEYTFTPLNLLRDHWLCTATVTDATSGIALVEFYVDNAYIGNDTTAPYEFEFSGKPTNNSQAIAYDGAGNSALSPIAHYYEIDYQTILLLQRKEALIIR